MLFISIGAAGFDGHGSARYGKSGRKSLSFFVARGNCGLSMNDSSCRMQSPN